MGSEMCIRDRPQAHGHWRGQLCRNGLCVDGRLSSFLSRDFVMYENDRRSKCPILKDFRARLRQAREEDVPAFIQEGRQLFKAPPPFAVTIVISHLKRRKLCRAADARWRRGNSDVSNLILETDDLGPIAVHIGLSVKALQTGPLVKGLWYTVECLEPLELQEQTVRWGETERRVVTVTPETFQRDVTMTAAVTAASVQGETIQDTVCVADLENPHMRHKDVLEMAVGRATHSDNLRFL